MPFKLSPHGNYLLNADDESFYVSYRPAASVSELSGPLSMLAAMVSRSNKFMEIHPETALCKDGVYLILNGDFRKDYEGLVADGYDACKAFYESQKDDHGSIWSTGAPIFSTDED